ncbi:MAG: tRNA 2-thiouridine(34) synthase MnmA [Pseudomonadales bacterium]|nr:tRNA 2-thiouridine(34) synthase MnmA [Pseudomonadales bacterium]MBO6595226.1 tRNA 2-thiouridine(34) synthase MnmA [Pseudomonadales bacterium]MBO6821215.1 tRNA 2-thiouridine(34) synthase MnmA [Pseudomonadales bacterium]
MVQANAQKIVVGMSGGVDSSVTALLCLQQGYEVEGLFMKNWDEDDGTEYCTAMEDLADAQSVCDKLGIKLNQANFAAEYWDNVFEHFLTEYREGRTPNPDVLCNREIKFQVFAQYARLLGADFIATGHYARLSEVDGERRLLRGADPNKDQSYFLQSVSQAQFDRVMFPIGELHKSEVRELAEKHGLPTHAKKDSTGICFIGERRFKDFLQDYLPANPGDIVTLEGEAIGEHQGLMYHTLGQRQGLRIGGRRGSGQAPWYVVGKDLENNRLIVAQGNDHPALFCSAMTVNAIAWIGPSPELPANLQVKIRYRQADQPCRLSRSEQGYDIRFAEPQRAVTPGQWACFYEEDICLGGGIIIATDNPQ